MRQIPRLGDIIGPGIDALRAVRPKAAEWVERGGRYADIFEGFGGQAALMLRYLADQVASARLKTSSGAALTALARSEFETERASAATAATGTVTLHRTPPSSGFFMAIQPGGAIPKGFRFRRQANPSAVPPVPAMTYTVTRDVPINRGQNTLAGIPVVATSAGVDGNAPFILDGAGVPHPLGTLVVADVPFDPILTEVASFDAGGGSAGENDDDLRAQAAAYATGQYGPVIGAVVAGALRGTGVHRIAVQDVVAYADGTRAAFTGVVVADASWGYSATWLAAIQQKIADTFQGFGCAIVVSGAVNQSIAVSAAVTLRDARSLSFTDEITAAIQKAVRAYFDDRPDWYTWRLAGLRAAISRADARILKCTVATVSDVPTNTAIAEPTGTLQAPPGQGLAAIHYLLASNGVSVSYVAPS